MKHTISKLRIFITTLALFAIAAGPASPPASIKDYSFVVTSTYGDRNTSNSFSFTVAEGGCIIAQVKSWARSGTSGSAASQLAIILNGSDRTSNYARVDGGYTGIAPLWTSYSVQSTQVSKVKTWTISVINFTKSDSAKGTLNLEYPSTQTPCELKLALSRTKGQIDLGWVYTGKAFTGSFLIERSTDGKTWSVIKACTQSAPKSSTATSTSYSCSDTGRNSKVTYYYRACSITSGSKCDTRKNITPATSVKLP